MEVAGVPLPQADGARLDPAGHLGVEVTVGPDVDVELVLARCRIVDLLEGELGGEREPPATSRKNPSMLAMISAPKRSAHQPASGSGSVLSKVMDAMLTVMAAAHATGRS